MGKQFHDIATTAGLQQIVREPTHKFGNLLDLVVTDLLGTNVTVGGRIQDHNWIAATVPVTIPTTKILKRKVWNYSTADWDLLNDTLGDINWEFLRRIYQMKPQLN